MIFSHNWLQNYFEEKIPGEEELAGLLNTHSFEVEGVESRESGDTLIDIDVLPNRAHDCLSHYGMAKEISVLTGLKLKEIENNPNSASQNGQEEFEKTSSNPVTVEVEDEKLCRRYIAVSVEGVKVGPSPDWLKERIESIDQKSINNIVDATNYIMYSLGQPMHAFDKDKLEGEKIVVRKAKTGEQITTLDNKEVELNEDTLIIADEKSPLAIAGVKGGNKAEVDENTTNLVLESANFNPVSVRKTSRGFAILTDSSKRFENEITPELADIAMNELVALIKEVAGGNFSEKTDIYSRKPNPYKVGFSMDEVSRLLGVNLSEKEVEDILNRFGRTSRQAGFEFEKVKPLEKVLELVETFVGVPYESGASVTYDAPNKFDCSSFTSYLFSQAGIAIPRISVDQYVFGSPAPKSDLKAGDLVFANTGLVIKTGIHKKTVEFLPGTEVPEGVDHVGLYLGEGKLIHTSSKTEKVVVEDLDKAEMFQNIVGYRRIIEDENEERYVVTAPAERLDLRIKQDLIEEIGRIYGYKNIESVLPEKVFEPKMNKTFYYTNKIRKILTDLGFSEVYTYVFGDKGEVEVQKPLASHLSLLRTNLSDGIQKSLDLNEKNAPVLGLDEIKIFEIGKVFPSIDGEYASFALGITGKNKKSVFASLPTGQAGVSEAIQELNKELGTDLKVTENSGILETNFDKLISDLPEPKNYDDVLPKEIGEATKFQKISPYPFMLRDIAVFVPNENNEDDILNIIKENAGELLVQTKLFDTYTPEGGDKTSYAFNLVFQSQEKTLTDDEINKIMETITSEITNKNWEVR